MKVVLISGKQGSGKTSLQKSLAEQWALKHGRVSIINFADVLYEMHDAVLKILHNYIPNRFLAKDGPLLQMLGTEWGRKTIDENIWVEILKKKISFNTEPDQLIIVGDCRFENEFNVMPDALRVRLSCPSRIRKQRCSMWRDNDTHPSEVGLDTYDRLGLFDLCIRTEEVDIKGATSLVMAQLDKDVWMEKR